MLDSVGTDHCPFVMEQKRAGKDDFTKIPNGAPGIEDRLQLLYTHGVATGRIDVQRMVALGSTNPARIFGLYPRKGTIAPGADADLVIYDPSWRGTRSAKTHFSKADRSIFEGFAVQEPMRIVTPLVVSPSEDLAMVAQRFAHRMPRLVRYLMEGLGTPDAQSADLMSYLLFDAAYTRALIDIGHRDASERIDEIEEFLRAGPAADEAREAG